jgi:hypothetical protein
MKTKHRILEELYQVQLINKEPNVTLVDVSLDIDILRKRINAKEMDFQSSLESLYATKDIDVDWNKNIATITQQGIVSLNSKTYLKEHFSFLKDKTNLFLQIGTFIVVIITLIISIKNCSNL